MKVEKLTIRLGRTYPGPEYGGGQFANVKPEVEISVLLSEGDSLDGVTKWMTDYCMAAVQNLKNELVADQVRVKPTQPQHRPVAPVQPPTNMNHGGVHPAIPPPPPVVGIPKVDPVTW